MKAYAFRMDDEWRVRVTGWGERAPGHWRLRAVGGLTAFIIDAGGRSGA
jgi:hypothetical protein